MTEQHPLAETAVRLGRAGNDLASSRLAETPLFQAMLQAGTRHIYADTADVEELRSTIGTDDDAIRAEVDGNTANQPLVHRVVDRILEAGDAEGWLEALEEAPGEASFEELAPWLYAVVCGRVGGGIVAAYAAGRPWEVSLQLHMALSHRPDEARRVGRAIRRMVPQAFVKVPFRPDEPSAFLIARDLEREGIPVNFTSTFSARQAVAAAMVSDVTRTNIFMGRLNQGFDADLLGEHVDLEAQRAVARRRNDDGVKTQLIVASVHDWRTFVHTAGCDVYTVPCEVLSNFLQQGEVAPEDITSQLETSYEDRLGIDAAASDKVGMDHIARLWRVEPELIEFLRELRRDTAFLDDADGDALFQRFDDAGFGDIFHAPDARDRQELDQGKLPDLDGRLIGRVPLDTHYSLLANADFERYQAKIDEAMAKHAGAAAGHAASS
ncbi:MAG TPA: transaldolase family protein [Longimicrobiales bacterium]|nr:transaldolase family protein [Longimicrobiales bacterium]